MKTCSTAFLVIAIMITLLNNKCSTTQSTMSGNLDDVSICTSTTKSVPRNLSWIGNYKLISCIAWKLSPDQFYLFHRNPSCYNNFLILNFIMLSAQYVVALYWQYFSVLFRCYVAPLLFSCPLFRVISIVLPVFACMFRQCSGVPPVFRVPVFLVLKYA